MADARLRWLIRIVAILAVLAFWGAVVWLVWGRR
jgi:hypothetical protein